MQKRWVRVVGVSMLFFGSTMARGADHADGSDMMLFSPDKSADITDVFAWMTSDATKLNLVMDVFPGAGMTSKFSNAIKYVFHTEARPGLLATAASKTDIICTFSTATPQITSCWVVRGTTVTDFASGNATGANGITSASGKLKVFAGPRNDPFFFNLAGFVNTARTAARALGSLTFDSNDCPTNVPSAVETLLSLDCSGATPIYDFFDKPTAGSNTGCTDNYIKNQLTGGTGNILALVVQIDRTLVSDATNRIVGVWGATNK